MKKFEQFIAFFGKNYEGIFSNLIVLLFSISLFISSLLVDEATLPKGYVLPKVQFIQITCVLFIVFISLYRITGLIKSGNVGHYYGLIGYLTAIVIISITSFASAYTRYLDIEIGSNEIYSLLFGSFKDLSQGGDVVKVRIAIFGNEFREEGLITYFLLITALWEIGKFFNRFNWHFISFTVITTGIIHAYFAIDQFYNLYVNDPDRLLEGNWVFGKYGQVNFFSGHMIVSLIFCTYYLGIKNIYLKSLLGSLVVFFLTIIFFSFSYWGFVVALISIVTIIAYEALNQKNFFRFLGGGTIVTLISTPVGIAVVNKYFEGYTFRLQIWKEIFNVVIKAPISEALSGNFEELKLLFLGSGFDTLGELFVEKGKFESLYVDRAHNIFLDVLVNNGLIGLIAFAVLLVYLILKLKTNWENRRFMFSFIIFFALILRGLIHTQSIINIVHLLTALFIMLAVEIGKPKEKEVLNAESSLKQKAPEVESVDEMIREEIQNSGNEIPKKI